MFPLTRSGRPFSRGVSIVRVRSLPRRTDTNLHCRFFHQRRKSRKQRCETKAEGHGRDTFGAATATVMRCMATERDRLLMLFTNVRDLARHAQFIERSLTLSSHRPAPAHERSRNGVRQATPYPSPPALAAHPVARDTTIRRRVASFPRRSALEVSNTRSQSRFCSSDAGISSAIARAEPSCAQQLASIEAESENKPPLSINFG